MTVVIFQVHMSGEVRVQSKIVQTLTASMGTGGGKTPMVAYPIQDGREMDKKQNGLGIGEAGDSSYTLDRTGGQSVAYPIQGTIIGRSDTAGPQGKGFREAGEPMYTIDTVGGHAVAIPTSVVRRLTPTECERLQGFPDNWTAGQADSHRYKQMGNAVAVPCVEWIMARLVEIDREMNDTI